MSLATLATLDYYAEDLTHNSFSKERKADVTTNRIVQLTKIHTSLHKILYQSGCRNSEAITRKAGICSVFVFHIKLSHALSFHYISLYSML